MSHTSIDHKRISEMSSSFYTFIAQLNAVSCCCSVNVSVYVYLYQMLAGLLSISVSVVRANFPLLYIFPSVVRLSFRTPMNPH